MAWLGRADIAERAVWVSTFRDGASTIGLVIKQTMDRRGAHWDPPAMASAMQPQYREAGNAGSAKAQGKRNNQGGQSSRQQQSQRQQQSPMKSEPPPNSKRIMSQPGSISAKLKDGKTLCPDFQRGDCRVKGATCPKGVHKCKVNTKGRVCGMNYHGASQCRAK